MPILPDGTVLPHFLQVTDVGSYTPGGGISTRDVALRIGEVVAVYAPGSKGSSSKTDTQYIVRANFREGAGLVTPMLYRCVAKDGFGSAGDHLRHSLRARPSQQKEDDVTGAIVLLACINGDRSQAVILDCLRHPSRTTKDAEGRWFDFEFNGVAVKINDDGSFALTVPGPTKGDGKPDHRDENNKGSSVTVAANGDIAISDNNGESITISPGDKTITMESDKTAATAVTSWKVKAPEILIGGGGGAPHIRVTAEGVELGATETGKAMDPVALATNTEARLTALEAHARTHVHPGVSPGPSMTAPPPPTLPPGKPVAATKVKGL